MGRIHGYLQILNGGEIRVSKCLREISSQRLSRATHPPLGRDELTSSAVSLSLLS